MCHDDDSRPPSPPGSTGLVEGKPLTLEAADGNRFSAYAARPPEATDIGAIVLPDVRGLHAYYCVLAEQFAEIGVAAVAVDYYGRTAGLDPRTDAFEFMPHFEQSAPHGVLADAEAAAAYLHSRSGGGVSSLFAVGFCYGGSNAWRLSAELDGLAGAVGFYGHPHRAADVIDDMRVPLLVVGGGADAGIPPQDLEDFARTVRERGIAVELVVYDGAPHSFFDRGFAEHRAACDNAWRRIRRFLGKGLQPHPPANAA